MHIYIDESGTFAIPKREGPSISCAGAVVVADRTREELLREFLVLSTKWPRDPKGEIKGRLLRENDFYDLVELLVHYDVLFDCIAIDMGLHDEAAIAQHRDRQAQKIEAAVTPRHHPNMIRQMNEIAGQIRKQSPQQHAQFITMNELVLAVLETKLLYFAQVAPVEIGRFSWRIDAKADKLTTSEKIWRTLAPTVLEAASYREPGVHLMGADYSHFARFDTKLSDREIQARRTFYGAEERRGPGGYDIGLVLREDMKFEDSRLNTGLQLADAVVSLAARAMRGNIGRRAWWHLGKLMMMPLSHNEVIHLIRMQIDGPKAQWNRSPPYHQVLAHLHRTGRYPLVEETEWSEQR